MLAITRHLLYLNATVLNKAFYLFKLPTEIIPRHQKDCKGMPENDTIIISATIFKSNVRETWCVILVSES